MKLARVRGMVVATRKSELLEGVSLQWCEPVNAAGRAIGPMFVACNRVQAGPGDLVYYVEGYEAAFALPGKFAPTDAAIVGWVDGVDCRPFDAAAWRPESTT